MVDKIHACYNDTDSYIRCRRENSTLDPTTHQSDLGLNVKLFNASPMAPARIVMGRHNKYFVVYLDSCRLIIGWYIK
jgi:hypothetical protein